MSDDRQENETPTYTPRPIDIAQLVADLKAVVSPVLYTDEGFARIAEELHARGVRSKLDTSISCPWCEKRFPAPDEQGRIPHHKVAFMSDWMECEGSRRELAPNGGLIFPSPSNEGLLRFVGTQLPVRTDPDSGYTLSASGKLIRWGSGVIGVQLDPNARIVPLFPMSEVPGHTQPVSAPGVPNPIPDRPLPDGVYNVIHFVQLLDLGEAGAGNRNWETRISDGMGGTRRLTTADLRAVLAEIPDVAPRYPTIWAYEQACRTIRERDDRIEKALEILTAKPVNDENDVAELVQAVSRVLQLRMPRTEPASPEQLSEVARALELVQQDVVEPIPAWTWVHAGRALAANVDRQQKLIAELEDDVTSTLVLGEDGQPTPCGTCSALEPAVVNWAVGRSQRNWPRCAPHLVEDALDDAGYEKDTKRCPSCHHLASSHYEDGSGCSTTIRDVGMGRDNHCPCTFDARGVRKEVNGE